MVLPALSQNSGTEIICESENRLLSRREITVAFRGGCGLVTRQSASEAISSKLGVPRERVRVLSLRGGFGGRDLVGEAFVYSDASVIERQLPKYLKIRELPKEERKKAREALKPKAATAGGEEKAKK